MNATPIHSSAELQDFLRGNKRVHAQGNGSKAALHSESDGAAVADLSPLRGISEYQPSEYTITVGAGAPVAEVAAALAEAGQYLPFDPLLPGQASIGGTVAGNLSGSRRYRYGGVRDFILGARVVDGLGRAFRVGGKVVKNSAGFDLSKFLVGSLGQYAIMTEATFKVFPDVAMFRSLRLEYASLPAALDAIALINQSVFELDALDLQPLEAGWALLARLGGSAASLPGRAKRFAERMRRRTAADEIQELDEAPRLWEPLAGLNGAVIVKVALSPKQLPELDQALGPARRRYGCGGNVAWLATDDVARLDAALRQLGLSGLCLLGDVDTALIGQPIDNVLAARVKAVLDPQAKLV